MQVYKLNPHNIAYADHCDKINVGQFIFAYLKDSFSGNLDILINYDGIIIGFSSTQLTNRLIKSIHIHSNAFLKPLFIHYGFPVPPANFMLKNTDGLLSNIEESDILIIKSKHIIEKYQEVSSALNTTKLNDKLYKFLAYIYTRSMQEIKPTCDKDSMTGFSYPFVNDLDTEDNGLRKFAVLESAEKEGYLQGYFHDYVHLCPQCTHSHLIYREVCKKCHSSNLEEENLIHHFRCATIRSEKEFKIKNSNHLQCPKCDQQLKHIGVDYDKPSSMYRCHQCQHQSQQIQIWAKCCNCEKETPVEGLLKQEIKSFRITEKNSDFLKNFGQYDSYRIRNQSNSPLTFQSFQILLKHHLQNEGDNPHCICLIDFAVLPKIEGIVGKHGMQNFWGEIIQIVRVSLNSSDELSVEGSLLYFTLFNTELVQAGRVCGQLTYLIQNLLEVNFNISAEEIKYNFLLINREVSIQENISLLNAEL